MLRRNKEQNEEYEEGRRVDPRVERFHKRTWGSTLARAGVKAGVGVLATVAPYAAYHAYEAAQPAHGNYAEMVQEDHEESRDLALKIELGAAVLTAASVVLAVRNREEEPEER